MSQWMPVLTQSMSLTLIKIRATSWENLLLPYRSIRAVWSLRRRYNISSFYIQNFKTLASLCSWPGRFESHLVENPEDRFSRDKAQYGNLPDVRWHSHPLVHGSRADASTCSVCWWQRQHHHLSRLMTKPTKWHVRQAKTQISLGIRPVWSVFAVHSMGS